MAHIGAAKLLANGLGLAQVEDFMSNGNGNTAMPSRNGGRILSDERTIEPRAQIGARNGNRGVSSEPVRSGMPERAPTWTGNLFPYVGTGSPFINPPHVDQSGDPAIDTTNRSDSPSPLYGTANPFAILGDLFARSFGMEGDETPQQIYTPVTGAQGGGNMGMIVVLLLLAAGAAYYFFVIRKKGASNG